MRLQLISICLYSAGWLCVLFPDMLFAVNSIIAGCVWLNAGVFSKANFIVV